MTIQETIIRVLTDPNKPKVPFDQDQADARAKAEQKLKESGRSKEWILQHGLSMLSDSGATSILSELRNYIAEEHPDAEITEPSVFNDYTTVDVSLRWRFGRVEGPGLEPRTRVCTDITVSARPLLDELAIQGKFNSWVLPMPKWTTEALEDALARAYWAPAKLVLRPQD